MSDIKHLDLDSEEFESAPSALRAYAKKLKKELDTATQSLTEFRGRETDAALSSVLTGFKNPNRVKRDLLDDGIDPLDNEAVKSWIETNGDDYARGAQPAAEPSGEPAAAHDPFAVVEQQSSPADLSKWDLVASQITPEMTGADVAALYAKHGL